MLETEVPILSVPALKGAVVLHKLAGGPTSDSWLLSLADSKAVLRIDKPLARALSLDRIAELGVLEQVARAGFGPAVIWADPAKGMLLTEYIAGRHWTVTDAGQPENIERLGRRLRELHSIPVKGPVLNIGETAGHYASIAGTAQASELHTQVLAILRLLGNASTDRSFCHNDLGYQNIVDTGDIMFVDWEYAAKGYSLFDMAAIVRQNQYSKAQSKQLQRAYFCAPPLNSMSKLPLYLQMYDLVAALWYQAGRAAGGVASQSQ